MVDLEVLCQIIFDKNIYPFVRSDLCPKEIYFSGVTGPYFQANISGALGRVLINAVL
jgi:hypothetical protein